MSERQNLDHASTESSNLYLHYNSKSLTDFGTEGLKELFIVADGHGPMGWYDRIHAIYECGKHEVFPAHNCDKWELVSPELQQKISEQEKF